MLGLFSSVSAKLAAFRVRPLKRWMFFALAGSLMLAGGDVSLHHSRAGVIGGLVALVSGIMALGMAQTPKTLHEAVKDLSDHLDFCQECNEPSVFCPKGLQLKNIVVELLKK
jgi:hypothetical protein